MGGWVGGLEREQRGRREEGGKRGRGKGILLRVPFGFIFFFFKGGGGE